MALIDIIMRAKDETNGVLEDGAEQIDEMDEKAKGLTSTLKGMRGPALAVTGVLTGLGIAGIKFASDLGEAQDKVNEVFGESKTVVSEFARTSARDFGISAAAANEYAGTLGLILNESGLTRDASADMSVTLVQLAADLGSLNNVPIDVALEKLRSGLVGEVEPLRTFGIMLNASAVETKALELNLADANGEISEAAKVQARFALIMEKSTTAQGNFALTSGSVANQLKTLKAQGEDLLAVMGTELLPVASKLLEWAINMAAAFINLPRPIRLAVIAGTALAGVLAGLVLVLPPLIAGIGALGVAVTALSGPLGLIALVGTLAAAVVGLGFFTSAMDEAEAATRRQLQTTELATGATVAQLEESVRVTREYRDEIAAEVRALEDALPKVGVMTKAHREQAEELENARNRLDHVNDELGVHEAALDKATASAAAAAQAEADAAAQVEEMRQSAILASSAVDRMSVAQLRNALAAQIQGAANAASAEEMDAEFAVAERLARRIEGLIRTTETWTSITDRWIGVGEDAETQTRRTTTAVGDYTGGATRAAAANDELADSFKRVTASVESLKLPTLGEIVDASTGLLAGNELSPLESTIRALLGSAPSVNISADSTLAQQLDALAQEGFLVRESGSGTAGEDSRAIFSIAPGQEEALASALFGVQAPPTMAPQITINVEGSILTEQDLQSVVVGAIDSAGEAGRTS